MRKFIFTAAIAAITSASFAQTDSAAFFLQKGLDERAKGRRMEAVKNFEKAYNYNKSSAEIAKHLADAYREGFTTEELYDVVLPWIKGHPNVGLYADEAKRLCPNCGSDRVQRRGTAKTGLRRYQRYQCQACGKWSRSGVAVNAVDLRGVA